MSDIVCQVSGGQMSRLCATVPGMGAMFRSLGTVLLDGLLGEGVSLVGCSPR